MGNNSCYEAIYRQKKVIVVVAVVFLLLVWRIVQYSPSGSEVTIHAEPTSSLQGLSPLDQPSVKNTDDGGGRESYPFQDPSISWEARVDDLVGRLSVEEIIGQTMALYTKPTPAIDRLGIKPYVWITECLHGQFKTNSTSFPHSLGLAASFSGPLLHDIAEATSYEVRAQWNANRKSGVYETFKGLNCFSPVINIMRHPLWGRNQETYGEDPFLSGSLVQYFVKGLQGSDPRYIRVGAGCKHFDAYGGPENYPESRYSFNAKVSMRDWRMTFLPQFKMCVDAGTSSLMCSYNSINGIPACANKQLLTDIARNEWGFKGFVVSDAMAIANFVYTHKYVATAVEAAAAGIKAGCNLELMTTAYDSSFGAVTEGRLTVDDLKTNVKPLMYARMRLGEFDPEAMNPYSNIDMSVVQSADHRDLARRAAQMSFVLLKNDGNLLPLKKTFGKIAILGPFAEAKSELYGNFASNVVETYISTVGHGLAALAGSRSVTPGCSMSACQDYDPPSVEAALAGAELVVVTMGTGKSLERGEFDRRTLQLPDGQLKMLEDVIRLANGRPVIVLLFNAGPVDISRAKSSPGVGAIMECFFPGQGAGQAIYNVLTATGADSVPAARLPCTWPASLDQVPSITDYSMEGRTYRYAKDTPLYPFGYGLSYTTFDYSALTVAPTQVTAGEDVKVSVAVDNKGSYEADEVIQVYMSWSSSASVPVPKLQLVGFTREHFKTGEHRVFDFTIKAEQMAVWMDDTTGWGHLKGPMTVFAGGQQPDQLTRVPSNVLTATFTVADQ